MVAFELFPGAQRCGVGPVNKKSAVEVVALVLPSARGQPTSSYASFGSVALVVANTDIDEAFDLTS